MKKMPFHKKRLSEGNDDFRRGDIIEFWSGYNNDIRYRAKVAGVQGNNIYIVWSCFWSPIRNDDTTAIKKLSS